MPRKGKASQRSRDKVHRRWVAETPSKDGKDSVSGADPLNALKLVPLQGSLPIPERGNIAMSDSPVCVCTPESVPSPVCEAGQAPLTDSPRCVCTPASVPSLSEVGDAVSRTNQKRCKIQNEENIQNKNEKEIHENNIEKLKNKTEKELHENNIEELKNKTEKEIHENNIEKLKNKNQIDIYENHIETLKNKMEDMSENRMEQKFQNNRSQESCQQERNIQLENGKEKRNKVQFGMSIGTGIFSSLQGNFHQGCTEVFGITSGKQCVANALSSIIFSRVKNQNAWLSSDIDKILTTGNELYGYLQASSTVQNEYLLIDELPNEIEVYDKCFSVQTFESQVGLIGYDERLRDDVEMFGMSILEALQRSFEMAECSFVCFGGNTFSVMKVGKQYFLFDSHARDQSGLLDANGKSTLIGVETLEGVAQHCLQLALSLSVNQNSQFEITPVNIIELGTDDIHIVEESSSDRAAEIEKGDVLLDRYFDDQECRLKNMVKRKEKEGKIRYSRNEYIRNYMKNWRKNEHARNIEKVRDKLAKQEKRLDNTKRTIEKERDKTARQAKRLDKESRNIERGRERATKQLKRLDKEMRCTEKERDKNARKAKRLDKESRNIEKERDKIARQAKRLDKESRNIEKGRERATKQVKRLDKEMRCIEKEKDKITKKRKRNDPIFRLSEKERERNAKQKQRANIDIMNNEHD
ncbi:putative autophagy-related protein 11 [Saccostrea cucullata]|uniref:putative autophagy-related protein 11 n=1 Tax=Saccostrea cuccullata TaxID=36930 RepID=UPI002ED59151